MALRAYLLEVQKRDEVVRYRGLDLLADCHLPQRLGDLAVNEGNGRNHLGYKATCFLKKFPAFAADARFVSHLLDGVEVLVDVSLNRLGVADFARVRVERMVALRNPAGLAPQRLLALPGCPKDRLGILDVLIGLRDSCGVVGRTPNSTRSLCLLLGLLTVGILSCISPQPARYPAPPATAGQHARTVQNGRQAALARIRPRRGRGSVRPAVSADADGGAARALGRSTARRSHPKVTAARQTTTGRQRVMGSSRSLGVGA